MNSKLGKRFLKELIIRNVDSASDSESALSVNMSNWTSKREGSGYRGTRAMPYSFLNEPSGSFTCSVYTTDTWDLGLKSHPNDMVRRGIGLTTPGFTV